MSSETPTRITGFNDSIHGHIELHPLLVKVINTPQFQRLRDLKQLGACYYVYPGASHNRFEHCIGTCHLAGKLARHLKEIHPAKLDDRDVLCVELAGLCHDLGHGPFSHMFDERFLPKANPDRPTQWSHEEGSIMMFDHLFKVNNLQEDFLLHGLILPDDLTFVKEMIRRPPNENDDQDWPYQGRERHKAFLYEIVSNERNKVDVDKWDYLARDCHHLGIKSSFDHNRFMKFTKVLTVPGENPQICVRDKECYNLYEMFHTRYSIHRRAYQHRVSAAIEAMICDAMFYADKHIRFAGEGGRLKSISETINDPEAYTKLSDHVFDQILQSDNEDPNMIRARDTLKRIQNRKLYQFVDKHHCGSILFCCGTTYHRERNIARAIAENHDRVSEDDVVVTIKTYNYGMKRENPCDQFWFYSKDKPEKPFQIKRKEISHLLPETFEDTEILVHYKTSENIEVVRSCFKKWLLKNGLIPNPRKRRASTSQ